MEIEVVLEQLHPEFSCIIVCRRHRQEIRSAIYPGRFVSCDVLQQSDSEAEWCGFGKRIPCQLLLRRNRVAFVYVLIFVTFML